MGRWRWVAVAFGLCGGCGPPEACTLEPDPGERLHLYRLDLATGNRSLIKRLTSKRNLYEPNLSVSPDEQRYALTAIPNESSDIMLVEGWR